MRRPFPLLSIPGGILTIVLLCGLGVHLWLVGGVAFSPGLLSAYQGSQIGYGGYSSHAEFEGECFRCHAPLEATQASLCTECHPGILQEIQLSSGGHSTMDQPENCRSCHREHIGRDYTLIEADLPGFDHERTGFSLVWHQIDYLGTPIKCSSCHDLSSAIKELAGNCTVCHAREEFDFTLSHRQNYGENCLTCHDGRDRMVNFDHDITGFPLEGKHAEIDCWKCHTLADRAARFDPVMIQEQRLASIRAEGTLAEKDPFKNTPKACESCHSTPELHQTEFNQNCEDCHSALSWSPALLMGASHWASTPFSHSENSVFSLFFHRRDFNGAAISCQRCHAITIQNPNFAPDLQACQACHSNTPSAAGDMEAHLQQVGSDCLQCHTGTGSMRAFNHNTVFALEGRHTNLSCQKCHIDYQFKDVSDTCSSCHAEPEIHARSFGLKCEYCHTAQGWQPAQLIEHIFPLDHGSDRLAACQTCHLNRYDVYTCYGCHEHLPGVIEVEHTQAGISIQELPDCAVCHPIGLQEESRSGS